MITWTWPLQPAPGPDPDRRDAEAIRDRRGELLRDELEDDRERARLLDREGVVEQRAGLLAVLAEDADLAGGVARPAASSRCGPSPGCRP